MLKLVEKQREYRKKQFFFEIKMHVLKVLNTTTNKEVPFKVNAILTKELKLWKGYKSRNVCMITGRARATTQKFRISRMNIREYGNSGFFIGFKKVSW